MRIEDGNFTIADDKHTSSSMNTSSKSSSNTSLGTSISLPSSLFQRINSDSITTGLVFTLYEAATLFPVGESTRSSNNHTITQVGSRIIAASVGQDTEFEDLKDPVVIVLQLENQEMVGHHV